jgi:Protein of unknown function (DUF3015)
VKVLLFLIALMFVSELNAARLYGTAGCGLGNLMFKKESQIFASLTNEIFFTQSFGLSSGTSNCGEWGGRFTDRMPVFIEANRTSLEKDTARGQGDTVDTLAEMLGCSHSEHFRSVLKENFGQIFSSPNAEAQTISDTILQVIEEDDSLAAECSQVG